MYLIGDLVGETGLDKRTIRYLIAWGACPRPHGRTKNAWYDAAHLTCLRGYARFRDRYGQFRARQEFCSRQRQARQARSI